MKATARSARVVVVTGGAQGIGRAFCNGFAAAGYRTVVADLNSERAAEVASSLPGGLGTALSVDVGNPSSVTALASRVEEALGQVDVLVNNAAIFSSLKLKPFEGISDAEWAEVLRINVDGVFFCCRAFAPALKRSPAGRIINIASAAAKMGRPNYLHYIASKGAVEAMTRSIARELGAAGVTANTLSPGAIFTEIPRETVTDAQKAVIVASQCIPRPGTPEDLVSTALHLASPATGFVTGQNFIVDGGVVHGG